MDSTVLNEKPSGVYFAEMEYKSYEKSGFATPSKKVELYSETLEKAGFDPLPTYNEPTQSAANTPDLARDYPLVLITGSRRSSYTHTQFHNIPRLRSSLPEPLAEVNPITLAKHDIADGELVALETPKGSIKIRVKADGELVSEAVSIPHGWAQANANELTDLELRDDISGFPQLRAILCRLRKL